jgi:hypothetical protein
MASIPTQEEFLAAARKSQETMIATIKNWLETARTATPKLTFVYAPLTGNLPKLPFVSLPFTDKLPTPQDAVANAYDLAEQLLANQRKFAEDLVRATAPLWPGHGASSPEVPSPNAWHNAVTDSEPKTVESPAPSAVETAAPQAAETAAPQAAESTAPQAAESTAPKPAVESTAPQPAVESTPAPTASRSTASRSTASRSTAAKRTSTGSAGARKSAAAKGTEAS